MNKKKIIGIILVVVVLLLVIGTTYSIYSYRGLGSNQELVMGDIYMYYNEVKSIDIDQATTRTSYDPNTYFEFTVSGKNTYTKKDIYYEIVLNHGDTPENRSVRIDDKFLRFRLVEVKDGEEVEIVNNISLSGMANNRIWVNTIAKNTMDEITVRYRLYMWIDDSVRIGYVKEGSTTKIDYDFDTWNNEVFASIKVNVSGDFMEKGLAFSQLFRTILSSKPSTTITDTDGTIYLSGPNKATTSSGEASGEASSEASGEASNEASGEASGETGSGTTVREAVDYNYVWYSGKLWRITAVNPDGTMKMITDGLMTTIAYGADADNKFYADENTTSYMYQWLNQEFLPTLYNYENIIVEDAVWNASPAFLNDSPGNEVLVNASVGLLNSYEHGKSYQNTSYSNGYLDIGYNWWLLNPPFATSSNVCRVLENGIGHTGPSNTFGVRPSIYLKSGVQLIGGTGTESNPYRIKGDQEQAEANVTLINTRQSGEYVNFDGYLYRIVGIENETTKLIKADYIKDESDTILTKRVASSTIFGKDTNTQTDNFWDYYLNHTWKTAITDDYEKMLVEGTYYTKYLTGGNYKNTACATVSNAISIKDCDKTGVSTWSGYVGLPRYGEMFASQTRDYTYSNAEDMLLITPYVSGVWIVNNLGIGYYYGSAKSSGGRPIINLKSEIMITGGTGLESNPYTISLPTIE